MESAVSAETLRLRRDALIQLRQSELGNIIISRKRKLHELYAVTRNVARSKQFPGLNIIKQWGFLDENSASALEEPERKFLADNNIEKGLRFQESTLPTFPQPYAGHPPEPGGHNSINSAIRAPVPPETKSFTAQPAPPTSTPTPIASPTPLPPLKPTLTRVKRSPRKPPQTAPTPPSFLDQINGDAEVVGKHDELVDRQEQAKRQKTIQETPPHQQGSDKFKDVAATVVEIDGIPVIQDTVTRIPDDRDIKAGVHPPPAPRLVEPEDVASPPETPESDRTTSEEPVLIPSEKKVPTRKPDEILDSQESQKSEESEELNDGTTVSTPPSSLKARFPATIQQTQQIKNKPLSITVNKEDKPARTQSKRPTAQPESQPDVSSPTSSDDGGDLLSTPGNAVLSSATSPDTNQLSSAPELSKATEKTEQLVDATQKVQEATGTTINPQINEAPSKLITDEIEKQNREPSDSLSEIQANNLTQKSDRRPERIDYEKIQGIAESDEKTTVTLSGPMLVDYSESPSPVSPDPSTQLQLENQLANGISTSDLPEKLSTLDATISERDRQGNASPKSPPTGLSKRTVDEESEDEDRVQLVGTDGSASTLPSPSNSLVNVHEPRTPTKPAATIEKPLKSDFVDKNIICNALPSEKNSEPTLPPASANSSRTSTPPPQTPERDDVEMDIDNSSPPSPPLVANQYLPATSGSISSPFGKRKEDEVVSVAEKAPLSQIDIPGRPRTPPQKPEAIEEGPGPLGPSLPTPIPNVQHVSPEPEDLTEETPGIAVPIQSSSPIQPPETTSLSIDLIPTISDMAPMTATNADTIVPTSPPTSDRPEQPPAEDISMIAPPGEQIVPVSAGSLPTPITRAGSKIQQTKPKSEPRLSKVVITSAQHAAAAREAEKKRLTEDEEEQGLIVVARRRTQQATSVANRGRSSLFPQGSRMDLLTRFGVDEPPLKEETKRFDIFDMLYDIKSRPVSSAELIAKSSKAVTTNYHNSHLTDQQAVRILEMVTEKKNKKEWPYEQITKAPEPPRPKTHWDYVLEEMKWLSEDFRGERRWKIASAKEMARLVVCWHEMPAHERVQSGLVIDRRKLGRVPKRVRDELAHKSKRRKRSNDPSMAEDSHPTPDLAMSRGTPDEQDNDDYFVKEEVSGDDNLQLTGSGEYLENTEGPSPAALFALKPHETVFCIPPTKESQEMLEQLPLYGPPQPPQQGKPEYVDDVSMQSIIHVSKYQQGLLELEDEEEGPPRKKSRYEYVVNKELYADDSDDDADVIMGGTRDAYGRQRNRDKSMKPIPLHPEQNNVALFRPEFKSTLQRIRNHVFRPPHDMPSAAFFEARAPSLWTLEDDERLRQLAKEYSHNWTLISSYLAFDGIFHSGAERRSSWECFERWVSLENTPPEFAKTPYYKHVQQRLEVANRVSNTFVAATANGQQVSQLKRKGTLPMRVDRRRSTRQFTLFEAMRKLAKKRETSINKQAQSGRAAQMAAMRKQQEGPSSSSQMRSPQYFSQLKHDKMAKEAEMKQQQQLLGRAIPHGVQGRVPNGVQMQMQGRPTPQPGPGGQQVLSNGRSPHPGQAAMLGVPRPNGVQRAMTPQEAAQHRMRAMQQQAHMQSQSQQQAALTANTQNQQMQAIFASTQQAALGQPSPKLQPPQHGHQQRALPTHAQLLQLVQTQRPELSVEQAHEHAVVQLQRYHTQMATNMAARRPPQSHVNRPTPGTGGTGVLIGANGPIGPGANTQPSSRAGTPLAGSPRLPQGNGSPQLGVSPRIGTGQVQAQTQQQQPQAQVQAQVQAQAQAQAQAQVQAEAQAQAQQAAQQQAQAQAQLQQAQAQALALQQQQDP